MSTTAIRKLIDIKTPVFDSLSVQARRRGMSLKRYIETILEEESARNSAVVPEGITDSRIISLIGAAKGTSGETIDFEEERLEYLLSK